MAQKILLADDSITIQKVISITFASENYELIIVGDGDSAIVRAKEAKPDLIMADVAMPGKNGYEVCEAIKNDPELSSIPVMLLAGTFEPLDKDMAEKVKADDSIVKPFESQELLNKVKALAGKASVHAAPLEEPTPAEAPAPEKDETESASDEGWLEGDFLGFPEEVGEKPQIAGADQLPDLDFLDSGGLFEEPAKEAAVESDDTAFEFGEADFGQADAKPVSGFEPEKEEEAPWSAPESFPQPVEAEAVETVEPVAEAPEAPAEEPAAQPAQSEPTPFWDEDLSGGEGAGEGKDAFDFPDVFAEEHPAPEPAQSVEPLEEVLEQPEPAGESLEESIEEPLEAPVEEAIETPAVEPLEELSAEASFDEPLEEPVEEPIEELTLEDTSFSPAPDESLAEPEPEAEPEIEEPSFEQAQSLEEPVDEEAGFVETPVMDAAIEAGFERAGKFEAPVFEPEAEEIKEAPAPAEPVEAVAEKAGKVVAEEAVRRLESIEVPREQLEEAVRKIVKETVEEIAWEVVPELAEELIRAEIEKVKEALTRLK